MKVVQFKQAETYEPEKNWKRSSLCNEKEISVEYFEKPPFHASPLHSHSNAQILIVLQGQLSVVDDTGCEEMLDEGDTVFIPGDELHMVKNPLDEKSVGLDIFVPGRSFDFWLKRK